MEQKKEPIKIFEAFAGYGGASFGLKKAGIDHLVIGYSENDKDACEFYECNFPEVKNYGDITNLDSKYLPDFDLFTGGFPCQPFSTVGKRLGELDYRGTLFEDILRICKDKKPKYILLENVKGLAAGKLKTTFNKIIDELKSINYDVKHCILNSKDYGVPQNRERLWIFGFLGSLPDEFVLTPPKERLNFRLKDFLDKNPSEDLYRSEQQIARIKELHNIEIFDVNEPLCYDYYNRKLRLDGVCMTLTPPEHNVIRIVEPRINGREMVRKLSIDEHFRLMGFDIEEGKSEIKYPPKQSYAKLGKRAGNGWDVNLVGKLIKHVFNQIK